MKFRNVILVLSFFLPLSAWAFDYEGGAAARKLAGISAINKADEARRFYEVSGDGLGQKTHVGGSKAAVQKCEYLDAMAKAQLVPSEGAPRREQPASATGEAVAQSL